MGISTAGHPCPKNAIFFASGEAHTISKYWVAQIPRRRAIAQQRLLVLVQDHGNRGTARRAEDHDPHDISGRGLLLVESLASAWSAEHSADGTTVWFELDLATVG